MSDEAESKAVADYLRQLQDALRDQETQFDKAVLLVGGGALSISAALVTNLEPPLSRPYILLAAWIAWGSCVLTVTGGYLLGVYAHRRAIRLLSKQEFDRKKLLGGPAKWIPRVNELAYVLLLTGFVTFGIFTFSNLEFEGYEIRSHQESQKEEGEKEDQPQTGSGQPTGAGTELAAEGETAQEAGSIPMSDTKRPDVRPIPQPPATPPPKDIIRKDDRPPTKATSIPEPPPNLPKPGQGGGGTGGKKSDR